MKKNKSQEIDKRIFRTLSNNQNRGIEKDLDFNDLYFYSQFENKIIRTPIKKKLISRLLGYIYKKRKK